MASSLAVDSSGNVIVTGYFMGVVDFGGGIIYSAYSGMDTFLVKYSGTGAHVWSKNFWSDSDDEGTGIALDGSGNIVLTGRLLGGINLGGGVFNTVGGGDIYLAKFTPDGAHQWSRSFG